MKTHYNIAWWNLENLFDTVNSPNRPDWLQRQLNSELRGWNQGVLFTKIRNLANIISKMNNGTGPDIIGVCEVENREVLEILVQEIHVPTRSYNIVHHDMSDQRGIDIAFLYDPDKFSFEELFSHVVLQRNATRDILQANFRTKKGNPFIIIGNHWHSRISGELETEPYRIIAGETLSYWLERIVEITGKDTPVMVMGDFNDEPYNRSIAEYALATHSRQKVINARNPRLLNLMYPVMGRGMGTFFYDNFPYMFDQIMVLKSMLKSNALIRPVQISGGMYQVNIVMFPEMMAGGDYPKPKPFGRPSSSYNPEGYSDHFPVSVILEE